MSLEGRLRVIQKCTKTLHNMPLCEFLELCGNPKYWGELVELKKLLDGIMEKIGARGV